jgi:hypothetical protein
MANPIIPKYNANPLNANAPAAGNLTTGELASNLTSGKLYLKLYDGSVKEISGQVSSVNSSTGDVVITPANIGAIATSELGVTVATLDGGGKLPYAQLPSIGTSEISALTTSAIAGLIPQLDSGGKISLDQIPSSLIGGLTYQGAWDADTNSPQLDSGVGTKGHYYVVSVPGNTMLDGHNDWLSGDLVIFDGITWDKVSGNDSEVVSVNNVFPVNGNITLNADDIPNAVLGVNDVSPLPNGHVYITPQNIDGAIYLNDTIDRLQYKYNNTSSTKTVEPSEFGAAELDGSGFLKTTQLAACTTAQIGGLIVGSGLSVDTVGLVALVPATVSTLGGIKAGSGLSVTLDGTISADIATSSDAGRVKPGTGLLVDGSGTLTPDNTYVICTDTDPQYFNGGTY